MPARRGDRWLVAVVVVGVALGMALRIWVITSPIGAPDADEAVVGLMARHMLDGEFRSFFWGQSYGGVHEAAQVSLLLAAGVPIRAALELAPVVAGALVALLTWRVGRRLIGPTAGILAGLLVWIAPAVFVWQTTKERGFYGATMVAGLVVVLFALRLVEHPSLLDAGVLGLAAGTGWYANPQVLFFALPALILVAARVAQDRPLLARLGRLSPVIAAGAVIGALPWLYTNLHSGFSSLTKRDAPPTAFIDRLDSFFRTGLPHLFGIRTPHRIIWPWGPLSKVVYLAVAVLLVAACLRLPRRAWVVPLAIGLYPLIFAAFPTSWYVNEPRYLYCLVPWLALAAGGGLASLPAGAWGRLGASGTLAAIGLLSIVGTGALVHLGRTVGALWDFAPGDLRPLVVELERAGPPRLFADYWVAQRITLATGERVVSAPVNNVRYQPYEDTVRQYPTPGYVLFPDSCYDRALRSYLAIKAIPHTRQIYSGLYALYRPATRILPEDVLADWATVRGKADFYRC